MRKILLVLLVFIIAGLLNACVSPYEKKIYKDASIRLAKSKYFYEKYYLPINFLFKKQINGESGEKFIYDISNKKIYTIRESTLYVNDSLLEEDSTIVFFKGTIFVLKNFPNKGVLVRINDIVDELFFIKTNQQYQENTYINAMVVTSLGYKKDSEIASEPFYAFQANIFTKEEEAYIIDAYTIFDDFLILHKGMNLNALFYYRKKLEEKPF